MKICRQNTLDFLFSKNTTNKTLAKKSPEQMSLFYHFNTHQRFFIVYQLQYYTPLLCYSFQRNNCLHIL